MGLFSRKKLEIEDDESLEMEEAPRALPAAEPAPHKPTPPKAEVRSEPAKPARKKRKTLAYGINDCIELMRTLPNADIEIVVEVVKKTLESTEIQVSDIIEHAAEKEHDIETRIATLESEIRDLQQETVRRNQEIAELQADLKETNIVKERLELAERRAAGLTDKPAAAQPPRTAPMPAMARSSGAAEASETGESTAE